ncbi:hypothetical protein WL76_25840 [Burkholderia ubonensis]|uniref:hypothetical protein n=1 Tax=Burkholderia ubonensis TaxID=101571 RepID=UPI00075AD501|nr:hypothetical protein [Burkholderia ubonensis]KWE47667.1 hypothetical protein WL76_25840 [Burkholderia ubonensis]
MHRVSARSSDGGTPSSRRKLRRMFSASPKPHSFGNGGDCGRPERAAPELLEAVTAKLDRMRIDRYAAVHRAAQAL